MNIEAGQTSNLWITAREAEGNALTLTASNLPANASFSAASGTVAVSNLFTFSPASDQAGQAYAVVFYASDVHGTTTRTLNITVANDAPWADYYASCYSNGVLKTGDDLKNALHDIIDDHTRFTYDQANTILQVIDECPTNSSMVQCLYLQRGIGKTSGDWNREHVWAQSHGIDGAEPAYSDVHHLHPTDIQANSDRNSRDFDIVSGTTTNYAFDGTGTAGNFEPPIAGKGDVARAMFYMAVRYNGEGDVGFYEDLELTNATPTSTESALFGKLDTLLDWNELDPVNDYEIRRNNLVYSNYQGNRNPFVDHPEWVRVVFDTNYLALPTLTAFSAAANGTDQIDLSFSYSGTGDGVIIVWDSDGSFDTPTGTAPAVGQSFAGGTVLYKGSSSPQSHTGLSPCQTVHYKCWTYVGTNYAAAGTTASATTAGPDAPAAAWAPATNATDFTAAWSGVSGVTEYVLDVATGEGFTGTGDGWRHDLRETMGTSAGTVTLADHEAADGFDNDGFTMTGGGADYPADIRSSSGSGGYIDPAGNLASSNANVYFTATGVTNLGFAIEGIDTTGCEALALSFGYRKEDGAANMTLGVEWSTNGGAAWNAVTVSNLPAEGAATGWYMISNLAVSAAALDSTNLSLRWTKNGGVAGRIDDVLLQGYQSEALFVPGYSNRAVSGATSAAVTGLTAGATYYFRVGTVPNCEVRYSPVGVVTTLQTLARRPSARIPGRSARRWMCRWPSRSARQQPRTGAGAGCGDRLQRHQFRSGNRPSDVHAGAGRHRGADLHLHGQQHPGHGDASRLGDGVRLAGAGPGFHERHVVRRDDRRGHGLHRGGHGLSNRFWPFRAPRPRAASASRRRQAGWTTPRRRRARERRPSRSRPATRRAWPRRSSRYPWRRACRRLRPRSGRARPMRQTSPRPGARRRWPRVTGWMSAPSRTSRFPGGAASRRCWRAMRPPMFR